MHLATRQLDLPTSNLCSKMQKGERLEQGLGQEQERSSGPWCLPPTRDSWEEAPETRMYEVRRSGALAPTRGYLLGSERRMAGTGTHFTLPTYRGSVPVYSSTTKNWFHTQPRLTRPMLSVPSCGAPGASVGVGVGEPAAHRCPSSGMGGGSSSSSSRGDSAAPARSPRPSGRGLMLGLRGAPGAWTGAAGRHCLAAPRSGAPSHGGLSVAAGALPPTGLPDRPAALNAAQPQGRWAGGGGGAAAPQAWTAFGVPTRGTTVGQITPQRGRITRRRLRSSRVCCGPWSFRRRDAERNSKILVGSLEN